MITLGHYHSRVVFGYTGPTRRSWMIVRFVGGFTVRMGSVAWHIWRSF